MREESERKWVENREESKRKAAEDKAKWDQNQAEMREESERKWQEGQKSINTSIAEMKLYTEAIGARWGVSSETSFRNGMAAILKDISDLDVLHVKEKDDNKEVFDYPSEIELDIIIRNGILIIVEIKSSVSHNDVYIFERKARFYERKHERTSSRRMVISPMVNDKAGDVAEKYAIEVYTSVKDVKA